MIGHRKRPWQRCGTPTRDSQFTRPGFSLPQEILGPRTGPGSCGRRRPPVVDAQAQRANATRAVRIQSESPQPAVRRRWTRTPLGAALLDQALPSDRFTVRETARREWRELAIGVGRSPQRSCLDQVRADCCLKTSCPLD